MTKTKQTFTSWVFVAVIALAAIGSVATVLGPGCNDDDGPTFTEAVETVYTPCDADDIKFRSASHGIQLAFRECGSNNFKYFTWSPNGLNVYYQASQGGWVRKDTGENYPLRIGAPRAGSTWLNSELLAYPDADGQKIGIYQVSSHILNLLEIDQVHPEQLQAGIEADEVLYLASETPGGVKDVYRLSANTAESEKAFLWMDMGVDAFTYTPAVDIACYTEMGGKDVICARGETGDEVIRVVGRTRGAISTDGRYLVTEGPGAPVKVFADDSIPRPDFMPETITPPALWITDVASGDELLWEGVHGTSFEWYSAASYYGSFFLWGYDGREVNRNVTLVDLRNFMKGKGWSVPLPQIVAAPTE